MPKLLGITFTLLVAVVVGAAAQPLPEFVGDNGGFLGKTADEEISQLLTGLYKERGFDLRFISVDSLGGKAMNDYSQEKARELGIKGQGYKIAAMIFVSSREKKLTLEFSPALEWVIPQSESNYIYREIVNAFRSGNYAQGIIDAFMRINFLAEQNEWAVAYDNYEELQSSLPHSVGKIVRMNAITVSREFPDEKLTADQYSEDYFIYLRAPDQKPVKLRFSRNSLPDIRSLLEHRNGIVYGRVAQANPLDINFLGWEKAPQ